MDTKYKKIYNFIIPTIIYIILMGFIIHVKYIDLPVIVSTSLPLWIIRLIAVLLGKVIFGRGFTFLVAHSSNT